MKELLVLNWSMRKRVKNLMPKETSGLKHWKKILDQERNKDLDESMAIDYAELLLAGDDPKVCLPILRKIVVRCLIHLCNQDKKKKLQK